MFVDKAKEEYPKLDVFMLGHIMGGFIAAGYGVKYPDKLKGIVLSGAATTLLPVFSDFQNVDFDKNPRVKSPNALSSLIYRDKAVVEDYENDPLVLKETNEKLLGETFVRGPEWLEKNVEKFTYPCLILHGGDDRIVTNEASKWFYEKISSDDKKIKIYEGFFDEILNEKEKDIVIDDIKVWIDKRI